MNPPLPKPTQPNQPKSDDKKQNVVFDQSKNNGNNSDSSGKKTDDGGNNSGGRVPLVQKPNTGSGSPLPTPTQVSTNSSSKQVNSKLKQPNITSKQVNPAPNLPQKSQKPTQQSTFPPSSLSALSSMSSNKIPSASGSVGNKNAPAVPGSASTSTQVSAQVPQKTVLGQPIPQAIRGEATPAGLGTLASQLSAPKPALQVGSQNNVSLGVNSDNTASNSNKIKQENPSIGGKDKKNGKKPNKQSKNSPKIATAKNPVMRFLPFIAGGVVLLIVIVVVLSKFMGGGSTSVSQEKSPSIKTPTSQTDTTKPGTRTEVPSERVTLEYWGLWESSEIMQEVIADFEAENSGIQVNYVQQSSADYRERLQTAIQSGSGPDLFRFHASWVPMLKSSLSPIPSSVATSADFKNNYYPVVTEQLVSAGQYVGLPLMYDGLVLFYNEDILSTASETPPSTWPELRTLAVKLTVSSADGIQRGGLAIGNATNVDHFSDILATLILQNGGNLSEADSVETRDALLFYTNFQASDEVWNETLPSSTVAFARGDVAMMFAPSWRAHEIKSLNPDLKFSTAPMPQLSEDEKITWASYWSEGISSVSSNKEQAALFLKYLSNPEVLRKFFSNASKVRGFGEIYPKADMADELAEDKVINAILEDAVYSQSGYMNSFTHDNGINDQTIKYYKVAVDAIIDGDDVEDVQESLDLGVTQVLKQYGVSIK